MLKKKKSRRRKKKGEGEKEGKRVFREVISSVW